MRSVPRGDGLDHPAENDDAAASPPDVGAADADSGTGTALLPRRPGGRRVKPLAILLLSAAVALAAGWTLATVFQSSAQRDAATAPPASRPILATVSTGNLVRERTFSGSVVAENQESLSLAVPAGALRSVVTGRPVAQGTAVDAGEVLTEVNGRPVFVVRSGFAFYRDVGVGDRGPDVVALQKTLTRLGLSVAVDGEFGAQTERAVRDWYTKNGYTPATREDDDSDSPGASDSESERQATAFVPHSEILGVKTLPSASLSALAVGSAVGAEGETDIVLGSATTTVTFEAAPADLTDIAQGSEVSIETEAGAFPGSVSSIAPVESTSEREAARGQPQDEEPQNMSIVTVVPAKPLRAADAKVRVVSSQIIVDQEALLVPTIAVVERGDTNHVVVVRRPGGRFEEVEVTVLGALDGRAAIVPSSPSAIRNGDQVRVGSS